MQHVSNPRTISRSRPNYTNTNAKATTPTTPTIDPVIAAAPLVPVYASADGPVAAAGTGTDTELVGVDDTAGGCMGAV